MDVHKKSVQQSTCAQDMCIKTDAVAAAAAAKNTQQSTRYRDEWPGRGNTAINLGEEEERDVEGCSIGLVGWLCDGC